MYTVFSLNVITIISWFNHKLWWRRQRAKKVPK